MNRPLPILAACAASALAAAAPGQQVLRSEALMDLAKTAPAVTVNDFELHLDMPGLPLGRDAAPRKLQVTLRRAEGTWEEGIGQAYRTITADHKVDGAGLNVAPDSLTGPLKVNVKPDGRTRKEWRTIDCRLDAKVRPVGPDSFWPKNDIDIRTWPYWAMYPKCQGAVWEVAGRYEAKDGDKPLSGEVSGYFSPRVRPGRWNMGTWDDGLRFDFDMGKERQNWNYGRLAIYEFPKVRDLSGFTGLRLTVAVDHPRSDVEVSLWLREQDGTWYYQKSAVPLCDKTNEAIVDFEDFVVNGVVSPGGSSDEDYALDLASVAQVGIGIIDPFGLGKVPFALKRIEAVKCAAAPLPPARVTVSGKMLSINDHDKMPVGLFGGYWDLPPGVRVGCMRHFSGGPTLPRKGGTEKFHIDVWHDRFSAPSVLGGGGWKEAFAARGRAYALKAKQAGYQAHLEFWNEPYLNWTRDLRSFRLGHFDVDRAVDGGCVHLRSNGWRVPFFQWTRQGDAWRVIDTTQHTYYSTGGNSIMYDMMLLAVAKAVKEVNPDVQVVISWGFRWKADRWGGWVHEYKPSIDRCLPYVDGASEHHYGGEPTAMVGMYEVLAAYGKTAYDKWLYSYNTETGELGGIGVHGRIKTKQQADNVTQYRRAIYDVRDMLYCASQVPDKIRSRTLLTWGSQARRAAPAAYGLVRNLRGRLVEAESADAKLWCAATVDGTDPDAMPPDGGKHLVVAIFNDRPEDRQVDLKLTAPAGTTFGAGTAEWIRLDPESFDFALASEAVAAKGAALAHRVTVRGKAGWTLRLPLAGEVPPQPEVRRRQFFSPDILQAVGRGAPFATKVEIGAAALASAKRAYLRLVVEDIAPGEALVRVGGKVIPLPKARTADCVNETVMLPIAPADLSAVTPFEFGVNDGNFAGFRVDMTSVVLEQR